MSIWGYEETFAGSRVVHVALEGGFESDTDARARPEEVAWRLGLGYDESPEDFIGLLDRFLDEVGADRVRALVIGNWGGAAYEHSAPVGALAERASRLVGLRALFLGEMPSEECEISWIQQADITPLLVAYPGLEVLRVRGGTGLELEPVRHERLRELALESGGLPAGVVRAVGACELPALRHLELWLGTGEYGGDATVEDLAGLLAGTNLPELRYLGLRDAEIADQVAEALASAPVVARLEELDLSMGTLTDSGVLALLGGQPLTQLRRLNLSHHFLSEPLAAALAERLPGVEVDVSDRQVEEDWGRYVAVSE